MRSVFAPSSSPAIYHLASRLDHVVLLGRPPRRRDQHCSELHDGHCHGELSRLCREGMAYDSGHVWLPDRVGIVEHVCLLADSLD